MNCYCFHYSLVFIPVVPMGVSHGNEFRCYNIVRAYGTMHGPSANAVRHGRSCCHRFKSSGLESRANSHPCCIDDQNEIVLLDAENSSAILHYYT
jgi:hypothetical protein